MENDVTMALSMGYFNMVLIVSFLILTHLLAEHLAWGEGAGKKELIRKKTSIFRK